MDVLDSEPVGLELRDTPEGHLWIQVLQDSVDNLRLGIRWWEQFEPGRRHRAMTPGERKALSSGQRAYARMVRSSVRFFRLRDSSFGFICDVLGYEATEIRKAMEVEILAGEKLMRRHPVARALREQKPVEV